MAESTPAPAATQDTTNLTIPERLALAQELEDNQNRIRRLRQQVASLQETEEWMWREPTVGDRTQ